MSFRAWRVKVSICQIESTASPLPTCRSEPTSPPPDPAPDPSPVKDGTSPPGPSGRKTATCPTVKQLLMDIGVSPPNPKVSKPSLGVRVLRTLFDNSPPTYTSTKSQAAAAAAQAKEQQRLEELQKATQQAQAQQGQKNGRPPTPKNLSEEFARRQSGNHPNVIDILADKSERFSPGLRKGGRGNASHFSSKSASVFDDRSSFHSFDEAHSSVSTDSEYDSSSSYRNGNKSYQEQEVRKMNRSRVRDLEEDYDLGSGHVDDSLVPDADQDLDSTERLEYLKQEIERLRLENLVLRQRGPVNNHHYDSDPPRASRASSITEVSNAEDATEEWIAYADYAPPGVTPATVARVHGQQQPGGYRRESRHHAAGGRYFPGEQAARVVNGGGGGDNGSSSETVSMVTDGSRASSRHDSGLLVDPEPQSGLTSRHNSGFQSDQEDYPSVMSWDGSRHDSGPLVVDRQEIYGLTNNNNNNNNNSRGNSRNNSGMLVDGDELLRGGLGTVTPLSGTSRANSRHNSSMQVDREGRNLPPGLVSPRISFEGKFMNSNVPAAMSTPLSNSTIKTVEERFTSYRTTERHLVETEAWNNHPMASKQHEGNMYEKYDASSSSQARQGSDDHVEAPSRTSTPPLPSAIVDYHDIVTEGAFGSQHSHSASPSPPPQLPPRRNPTPPQSRGTSHELDPTNSTMFSYPIPAIITVPRSRSAHKQLEKEDLSQFLQHHRDLSMDNARINSVPRSRSTHSQMSNEDSSSVASQHQSTLERLMISQQRRQNMSSNPMSVNASPDQQYSRNSPQLHTRSPHRR